MQNKLLTTKTLEDILQRTLSAIKDGRTEIYEVAEAAQEECNRIEEVLKTVRLEMNQAIYDEEELTKRFISIRHRLYKSNKEFESYSEEEKKQIYEEAMEVREALNIAKEREGSLRVRRDNLEQTLSKLKNIAGKAERLVSQVGVALNFLAESLDSVNEQFENMQAREHVGQEILRGQEIERKRMAGEIHDGPVQDLANMVVQLEICERLFLSGFLEEAGESYKNLKSIAQGTIGQLRRIIYDLNPMTLDDLGLVVTVKNFLSDHMKQTGVETQFVLLGKELRLDTQIEMALFRIIQESVNNSRKHAKAQIIEVTIEYSNQFIIAEIKDNGVGFDLQEIKGKIRTGKHYGLLSMESRINVLQGSLSIQSQLGKGTTILVKIPLQNVEWGNTN